MEAPLDKKIRQSKGVKDQPPLTSSSSLTPSHHMTQAEAAEFDFSQVNAGECTKAVLLYHEGAKEVVYEIKVSSAERSYHIFRSYASIVALNKAVKKDKMIKKGKVALADSPKPNKREPERTLKAAQGIIATIFVHVKPHATLCNNPAVLQFIKPDSRDSSDKLTITVNNGSNLASKKGGLADPFCVMSIFQKDRKAHTYRTPIKRATLDPVWNVNNSCTFTINMMSMGASVSCWDWSRLTRNDFMGRANIPLRTIPYNKEVRWQFPVHSTLKYRQYGKVQGMLDLTLFYGTTRKGKGPQLDMPEMTPEQLMLEREQREYRARKRMDLGTAYPAGKVHLRCDYYPPNAYWEGYIGVSVVDCSDLKPRDKKGTPPDPYVVLSTDVGVRYRTQRQNSTLNPVYDETFYFYVPPLLSLPTLTMDVSVYDHDQTTNRFMGSVELLTYPALFGSVQPACLSAQSVRQGPRKDDWFLLAAPPPDPSKLSKRIGKLMAEQGWTAKLPIVLVPGFMSSGMEILEGRKKWKGSRVWLSLTKLGGEKMHAMFARDRNRQKEAKRQQLRVLRSSGVPVEDPLAKEKAEAENAALQCYRETFAPEASPTGLPPVWEQQSKNRWVKHMMLSPEDGLSDPAGIQVRAINDISALTYLDPGLFTSSLSYVMGPLVKHLRAVGYAVGHNLLPAPYDWRLSPSYLEKRDGYFTKLKAAITEMVARAGSPVVLLGHSMGNRTIQYFLAFVNAQPSGKQWIDTHIHTFLAVGAPFLGAPKTVRGLISGDAVGLDSFLTRREAINFARTVGAAGSLFPLGQKYYNDNGLESIVYVTEEGQYRARPRKWLDFLATAGSYKQLEWFKKYYWDDPLFGIGPSTSSQATLSATSPGTLRKEAESKKKEDDDDDRDQKQMAILGAPPCKRLYAIYGVNLPTERFYFFRPAKSGAAMLYDIDPSPRPPMPGFEIKNGWGFETPLTPQPNIKRFTGKEGCRSGDGTVTYSSLSYCEHWRNSGLEVKIDELDGAEHRAILSNRLFFHKLLAYVAERRVPETKENSKGDGAGLSGSKAAALASLTADIDDTPLASAPPEIELEASTND